MKPIWIASAVFVISLSAAPARAQGLGINAGVSADPDQFYFGIGYETAELLERLRFRPNLEVGVGDEATLITANFEFAYRIPVQQKTLERVRGRWPRSRDFQFTRRHRRGGRLQHSSRRGASSRSFHGN